MQKPAPETCEPRVATRSNRGRGYIPLKGPIGDLAKLGDQAGRRVERTDFAGHKVLADLITADTGIDLLGRFEIVDPTQGLRPISLRPANIWCHLRSAPRHQTCAHRMAYVPNLGVERKPQVSGALVIALAPVTRSSVVQSGLGKVAPEAS